MARRVRNARCSVVLIVLLLFVLPGVSVYAANLGDTAIVYVVDISGSMANVDAGRYWQDTVSLGLELAPKHTEVALVAVSDFIEAQTPLLDVADAVNRAEIMGAAKRSVCTGYTDFALGLRKALEILDASNAKTKHVILIGDILESGFKLKNGDYSNIETGMSKLADELSNSGIAVHLFFLGEAVENTKFMPLWDELVRRTGGELTKVTDPVFLYNLIENLYFSGFAYQKSTVVDIEAKDTAQSVLVNIPQLGQNRTRLCIMGSVNGIQAFGDGFPLELASSRSYVILDLPQPYPETVVLTLPKNSSPDIRVYTLVDAALSVDTLSESTAYRETEKELYRQLTVVTLTPSVAFDVDTQWQLAAFEPNGHEIILDSAHVENGKILLEYYPETFGTYTFDLTVSSEGVELSARTELEISAIELPIAQKKDYSLWIAIVIGAALILSAILFAVLRKRREKRMIAAGVVPLTELRTAVKEMRGELKGKLDIYGIIVDGGKAEIPALSYRFESANHASSVTLETVMERSGIPYHYPAAAKIRFLSGGNNTLTVKNSSDAVVYCAGQPYYRGQQVSLAYGQKVYIVFEEQVSEYEFYYQNVVEMAASGERIQIDLVH